ncbi:MAG: Pycsar system effector family protein [Cyanobacteria bacterium P01_D01_bin.73]
MALNLVPRPKESFPGRETIYLLRTIHQNQTHLISLADQKANILISIVAVVITILSTNLSSIKQLSPPLLALFFMFLIAEFVTIGLGLLVIFPKNISSPFKKKKKKKAPPVRPNPIFFGTYLKLSEEKFVEAMFNNINDLNKVRRMFLVDIYKTGLILKKKYELLQYAYGAMIFGLCCLACLILGALFSGM